MSDVLLSVLNVAKDEVTSIVEFVESITEVVDIDEAEGDDLVSIVVVSSVITVL